MQSFFFGGKTMAMGLKTKKTMMKIGIVLCILVIVVCGTIALVKLLNDRQSSSEYNSLRTEVVVTDVYNPEIPLMVDFDKLREINEDIVAWLYVPVLNISYPVMQAEDNDYYLHRNVRGEYRFAGSLFMDMDNHADCSDPNTIIYGHNMKNGSMFGTLWKIPYQNAASEDPYFWILTPEKAYRYQMFSAYDTKIDSETYHMFPARNSEFKNWCYLMASWSMADFEMPSFSLQSRIVTLSTCSGLSKIERTIVQGFCESEYEYMIQKETTILTSDKGSDDSIKLVPHSAQKETK